MNKKVFFLACILAMLLLCSCQSPTVTETTGSTTPVFSVYQYQDEVSDHLTADVEVKVPQSDFTCPVYQTKMYHMSYEEFEQLKKTILKDDTIINEVKIEEEDHVLYSTYTSSDETLTYELGIYGSGFFYQSKEYKDMAIMKQIFTDNSSIQWWSEKDLVGIDGELDFASRQEVVQKLEEFLEQFHISVTESAEIFALNQQTLTALAKRDNASSEEPYKSKEEWTKEDECYVVTFTEELNFLPVLSDFENSNAVNEIEPTTIEFVYQNGKITYVSIDNPYCDSKQYDQIKLLPFEDIVEALHKKYDSVIWDESQKQEMKSVELSYYAYYPDDTKEIVYLRPVWVFEIDNPVGTGRYTTHILFDAETGKEVIGN